MESMSDSNHENIDENPSIPITNTEPSSTHPQSTIETFTATPSTFRRASASPPASLPLASAQFLASEITRPASVVNGATSIINMPSAPSPIATPITIPTTTTTHRNNEQREVARVRILAKVTEKYPNKPLDFRNRKVNKQLAIMFPENTPVANGTATTGGNSPNISAVTPLPSDSKALPQNAESSTGTRATDMDDEEERKFQNRKQIPSSADDSTPREMSQLRDFPHTSRSTVQQTNGNEANGDRNNGDLPAEVNIIREIPAYLLRQSPPMDKMKLKGIVVGYYRLSDVSNVEDKHAVFGKIDKGGDLFTTVSKETRSGSPVPSQQYLASKVQCTSEKICFEPHLQGLNKAQLKQYVLRRLEADWANETEQSRQASELQIANEVRNDKSLQAFESKKHQPSVFTGVKRAYSAFAEENEDDDEDEDESPLSEINETTFSDDEEGAYIPAGGSKKRKPGRKSIRARTSKGEHKETDGDDIGKGVCIGVWSESNAEALEDKHAVYSYLDSRNSLWSRVYHVTKDGRHIDQPIPFPRGTVKWDDIILDEHLSQMDRDEVKEYVIENRKSSSEGSPDSDVIKKERKPRKSNGEHHIKQEPYSAFKSKTSAVLLGYWKLGLAPNAADKNAVYGYVDTSGRFNLQVRKHTRDGRELTEVNPDFPGNGRVQKENMVLEDHLKHLSHSQVQSYTRRALAQGVADLVGQELVDAELRIAAEVAREKPSDIAQEKVQDEPRVKRKYTRRSTVQNAPEEGPADDTPMRPMSRPHSRMSGLMMDPSAPMGGPPNQAYMHAHPPYGFQPNGVPGVAFGPNGSMIFNGIEYHAQPPAQPSIIDETGTTIINNGLRYVLKTNGAFKGKFVHAHRQLITVGENDYTEYRVLVPTDI